MLIDQGNRGEERGRNTTDENGVVRKRGRKEREIEIWI